MATKNSREFVCGVVNETVRICLLTRPTAGLRSKATLFVKCDQNECQYVAENKLPCPLNLSLFQEEIHLREEKARLRREKPEYY
jgi:hypothetical protein